MSSAWLTERSHEREELLATLEYSQQQLLTTRLTSPWQFSADCTADRLHMASCSEYAAMVKHMTITDDSLQHLNMLTGMRFPRLNQLTYEHALSSPSSQFGMVRFMQCVFEHASETTSPTLSLLFRSAKAPLTTDEDDWQYSRAAAIAVGNLIKVLDSKHTLHIRLQFQQDDVIIPACATQFFTDIIGLIVKRNRPQDQLHLERAPEACWSLLTQHISKTDGLPQRFQLSTLSALSSTLRFLSALPGKCLLDLTLGVLQVTDEPAITTADNNLRRHILEILPRVLCKNAMLAMRCPRGLDAFERSIQPVRMLRPYAASSGFWEECSACIVEGSILHRPSRLIAFGCSDSSSLDELRNIPMLSLRGNAAEMVLIAMKGGTFASDTIRCLHVSTDFDWDEPTDYAMIHAALPNLVEYVATDHSESAGYGFYKLVEAFHTSHYGYLCIGRQQLAAVTLAIDLAGLELPHELLHKVLLPAVLRVMRRCIIMS
eukprot:TRINITY_DN11416_c4_g10_i1.p1 TRINITY_DN11416_c4_g10~~TRINITY_DN11416_c4_g10_i1.p1  ORF type:complete len:488 (+),score=68.66 TRINITY_DN11416_c4_g10_i1:263-1726(+)